MARIIPPLIADRGGEAGDVGDDNSPASRPFPELLVEGFRHRKGRRSLDPVEAAEQGVGRPGNGLHDHARARRLAHPLDDHARSRKRSFNEVVRGLARGGRPGEAEDAAIGRKHDEVGLGGVDRARRVKRFLDDGVVAAQNHVDQHAVTEARTLDRRGEERQGSIADERDPGRRELRRGARQGLRCTCEFRQLVLVQTERRKPQELEAGLNPSARLLQGVDPGAEVGRRIPQPRKIGHHGSRLTLLGLSWKRWRRPDRQRCAGARSRRWRT